MVKTHVINHGGASDALKYSNDDVFSSSNETGATSRMYTNIRVGSNVSVGADVDAGVVATVAEFISDVGSISNVDGISGVTANQKRNNNDIIANTRMVNPKHNCWWKYKCNNYQSVTSIICQKQSMTWIGNQWLAIVCEVIHLFHHVD